MSTPRRFLLTSALLYLMIGFIGIEVRLLQFPIIPKRAWLIVGLLIILSLTVSRSTREYFRNFSQNILTTTAPFIVTLALILVSDFVTRSKAYLQGLPLLAVAITACAAALLIVVLIATKRLTPPTGGFVCVGLLLFVQTALAFSFIQHAAGRLLFSDDHPSFLYRLTLLREHFPAIPFYNVEWNAGYPVTELYAVGVLGVFYLTWPLIMLVNDFGSLEGSYLYTLFIPYLYIFVVPLTIYASARILKQPNTVAAIAAVISLAPTMSYFEWLLKYGTIGFALSAGLFPLTFALTFRFFLEDRLIGWWHTAALTLVSFICLTWGMTGIAFVPLVIYSFSTLNRAALKNRGVKYSVFLLAFILLNGPPLISLLNNAKVTSILSANSLPGTETLATETSASEDVDSHAQIDEHLSFKDQLRQSLRQVRLELNRFSPLVLLFTFFGFYAIPPGRLRRALSITMIWLLALAALGDLIKPQLEFRRLFLHLGFLGSLVSAIGVSHLLNQHTQLLRALADHSIPARITMLCSAVIIYSALLLNPIVAFAAYTNRTFERFTFADTTVHSLSQAIKQHGGDGRTFFASFILHDLASEAYDTQDGGHVAPLPSFTGKPLYAFYFYHQSWSGVDPMPSSFRDRGAEGIEEFFDLLNVSAVVTFNKPWRRYCSTHNRYSKVFEDGRFRLYTRKSDQAGYFLKGRGEVFTERQKLFVKPQSTEVVVKFRYFPQLRVDPLLADIYPVSAFSEETGKETSHQVDFIGLRATPEALANGTAIEVSF